MSEDPSDERKLAELEKLKAEKSKLEAEHSKVLLEAADLRQRWFKKPAWIQAAITAFFSPVIVLAYLYFTYLTKESSVERAKVERERDALQSERKSLSLQVNSLIKQKEDLEDRTRVLDNRRRVAAAAAEGTERRVYQLQEEAALGNVRTYVERLGGHFHENDQDGYDRFLTLLVSEFDVEKKLVPAERRIRLEYLRKQANNLDLDPISRSYLHLALSRVLRDEQYVQNAVRLIRLNWNNDRRSFRLLMSYEFDSVERGKILCSLHPNNVNVEMLLTFDPSALVHCRGPLLASIINLRTELLARIKVSRQSTPEFYPRLAKLSPQAAFCVWASEGMLDPVAPLLAGTLREVPPEVSSLLLVGRPIQGSPGGVSIGPDQFLRTGVCGPWLEPDLRSLREVHSEVMKEVIEGNWISRERFKANQ